MAAIPTWKQTLLKAGVPHELCETIGQTYANADIFPHAFVHASDASDLDKYAKRLLTAWDATLKEEDGWSYHPAMGTLRAVRTTLHASVQSQEILPAMEVDVSLPTTGPTVCQHLGLVAAGTQVRLSEADRNVYEQDSYQNFRGLICTAETCPVWHIYN